MSHWCLCSIFVIGHAAGLPDFSKPLGDPSPVRYLLVNTQQRKPMNQTMLAPLDALRAVAKGPIPENPDLKFGISTLFSPLHDGSTADVNAISELLEAAEATGVPVFIGLDGENWWSQSGLSNWWNPSAPGYDPANRENVEWIAPDGATNDSSVIKISWRNWGRQIRVAPQQNIHSPAVLAATRKALTRTLEPIVSWYQQLAPENRWLLAGVKVGWEASIGWNAFYYPDGNTLVNSTNTSADPHYGLNHSAPGAAWGAQQLGYAAAASAGLVPSGEGGVLTRGDIAALVHMYLGNLTQAAASTGFPLDRLYTHVGGTLVDHTGDIPHVPFRAGITGPDPLRSSTLGVSIYARPPSDQPTLMADLQALQPNGGARWASVEWGLGMFWAPEGLKRGTAPAWVAAYNATLSFGNCRLLAFYNWNPGSPNVSLVAARQILADWRPPRAEGNAK